MTKEANITKGIFVKELDNRFRCLVNISGKDVVCYVSASCKLGRFLPLCGKEVLLLPTKKSAFPYVLFAVKVGHSFCLLNLSYANTVIARQIHRKVFDFLGKRKLVATEKAVDNYKSDLYIQDSDTVIEVKTVLSSKEVAPIFTIHSERMLRQLEKIQKLLTDGHRVVYLIVALSPYIKEVTIDEALPIHHKLKECISLGMELYGVSLHTHKGNFEVYHQIGVSFL